jgi:hypothetical protein
MAEESTEGARSKRSRRDVLAGAAGAVGVITAQAVVGAKPAYAGSDGDVVLGQDNQVTAGTTGVQSSAITGLHGRTTATNATGVFGEALNSGGIGVHGTASAMGVRGDGAGVGEGVHGEAGNGGIGVVGNVNGTSGYGVQGGGPSVGVWAVATNSTGWGVGGSGGTYGLWGQGGVAGVYAFSGGTGVIGEGDTIGVHGISAPDQTGIGLQVDGRCVFRTAGVATVPSGTNRVTKTLAGVSSTDMILATVQQTGAFSVKNAVAGSGQFTIYLNKAPTSPATVKVAWFVISAS